MSAPANPIKSLLSLPQLKCNPKYVLAVADAGLQEVAREEARQGQSSRALDPLALIISGQLQIKTKSGERVPLVLNACQRVVWDIIQAKRAAQQPIRLWILKFRQGGISTLCEALLYALTSQQPNRSALVMADEKDKANYIHGIAKFFHEQMRISHVEQTPELDYSNERKLSFAALSSSMYITTAENVDAARARTVQYCHLSEAAFYRDLDAVLQALAQSVPDHPDTAIICETTANGAGTPAHREWLAAKSGKSAWQAIFLPWFIHEEHVRPAPEYPIEEIIYDRHGGSVGFLKEEERLQQQYGLSAEQLNWRRWAIVNKCQRQVKVFRVEMPSDDEEAWAVSGNPYYDASVFDRQMLSKVLKRGYLVQGVNGPEIRETPDGPIRFFEWELPNETYLLPCDPNDGGEDECAGIVRSVRGNRTVAELASLRMEVDELAQQMWLLSEFYGGVRRSQIIPERNGVGAALVLALRRLTGNLWRERITSQGTETTDREGWYTDSVSRPLMFESLGKDLRDGAVSLAGERSLTEVRQLVDLDGRPEAPPGGQDGLAICHAIASHVRNLRPPTQANENWRGRATASRPPPKTNMGISYD
jgi:hypothetical protein